MNTLDSYHKKITKSFNNNDKELSKLTKKLKSSRIEYTKLLNKSKNKCSETEIKRQFELKNNIKELEKKIKSIENKEEESKYYLNTMDLLSTYFNKVKNKKVEKKESIIDFLNNKNTVITNNLEKFVTKEKQFNKKSLFTEYLSKLDDNNYVKIDYVNNYTFCENCKKEKLLIQSEALYVCDTCGDCNHTLIDSEKPSYKEPIIEVCSYSYKRYNHFLEWLNKFQALETTTIPEEVYEQIALEIKKEKIKDLKKITYDKLRIILKKINKSKYYEHIFHIINKINGVPPPKLSKELEEKLKIMFKKTQEPFSKFCPEDRTNFLSYSYVIRKFLQLLNEYEYVNYFPLLKSREKLYQQDLIWKSICKQLNWNFIPSI